MPATKSCDACRSLHYKCDAALPRCSRCAQSDRECRRDRHRSRLRLRQPTENPFPHDQVWVKPPPRVDFILESGNDDADDEASIAVDDGRPVTDDQRPPVASLVADEVYPLRPSRNPASTTAANSRSPAYPASKTWPLHDATEATLLRHFVEKVSPFFDCTDPQRHFAIHIPYRARHSETLLNAILAMSARHLNRTASLDPFVSDHYYEACLAQLIPALNSQEAMMDDDLLAATVILRLLEEYDAPLAGSDLRRHSFGTKALIQSSAAAVNSSLREAVYWSGLRQEIYNSISLQRAPDVDLSSLRSRFTPQGTHNEDCAWANEAIAHCADVLLFCFGEESRSLEAHNRLKVQNQQWRDSRPDSFDPYFEAQSSDAEAGVPDVRYGTPWHTIGNQYNQLSRVLLSVHDPSLPTVGPLRRRWIEEAEYQIRVGVRKACGIGLSNTELAPAMVISCMAIHLCGDRFVDPDQQDQLIQVLRQTESLHGWPTQALQQQLQDTWVAT